MAVVDGLEVVEISHDQRQRRPEARGTCELERERFLEMATVGEPGEAVDVRLALDDRVQAGVLERDHRLRSERLRDPALLVAELSAPRG